MNNRICSICGEEKEIEEFSSFYDKKSNKNYKLRKCKECEKKLKKEYSQKNKEKIIAYKRKYYLDNKIIINNKRKQKEEYYKEWAKKYKSINKEKIKEYMTKYRQKNKNKINEEHKKYIEKLKKEDKYYYLKKQMRSIISNSFRRNHIKKNDNSKNILGCDFDFFKEYLLSTFKNNYGYDWDGVEKVHIDHIKPLATAKTEKEIYKLCHYTNLQLLKAEDNLKKGKRV